MTDHDLARMLQSVSTIDTETRRYWAGTDDLAEKDSALIAMRHAIALQRAITTWISTRAVRATLGATRRVDQLHEVTNNGG